MSRQHAILVTLALALLSCVREEQAEEPVMKTFDCFTVSVEETEMTKAHMEEGGAVKWDVGDCIGVLSDTQQPVSFYRGEDGVFHGERVSGTRFYAIYPYDPYGLDGYDSDNPLKIKMMVNTNGKLPMVAKSTDNHLLFKQTCGMIRIAIDSPLAYSYVGLEVEDSFLSGQGLVDLSSDNPCLQICHPQNRAITPFYRCEREGKEDLYFLVPVSSLEDGFELFFYGLKIDNADEGVFFSKTTRKSVDVSRGEMKTFPLDFEKEFEGRETGFEEEKEALIAIYNALGGDSWGNNSNWCSDTNVGEWYGVTVDVRGHVVKIELPENKLRGAIPDVFGSLKELKELNLCAGLPIEKGKTSVNIITGSIPASIWSLQHLERLELSGNSLSGSLPESIGDCKALTVLEVEGAYNSHAEKLDGYGYLTGPIPDRIGELKRLFGLNLQSQELSGVVPASLNNLRLRLLHLNNNHFSGALPDLRDLSDAVSYLFSGNNFSGSIPAGYASLLDRPLSGNSRLSTFWIQGNKLSGELPTEIVSHPKFSERAYDFIRAQQEGYKISIDKVPACKHVFETLDGHSFDLGAQYAKANYTMIVRWTEWCQSAKAYVLSAIQLAEAYKEKGLQTIWAYGGGDVSARDSFMSSTGLDEQQNHIVECFTHGVFGGEKDYAVWMSSKGYGTPFVEIVDKEGNIVFIDDDCYEYYNYPFANSRSNLDLILEELLGDERYESTDYSKDGLIMCLQEATVGKGIDVVIMGDAFSDRLIESGTYDAAVRRAQEALFSEEPYKSLRSRFNVYEVNVVSKNEAISGETALGTWFGTGTYVCGDNDTVQYYAKKALSDARMEDALIIVLINRDVYAGTCYMYSVVEGDYGRGLSIAYCPVESDEDSFTGLISHEAGGHGFAKLADEYAYYEKGAIPADEKGGFLQNATYGWNRNVDFVLDPLQVKWTKFIFDNRFSSEGLGVYEGACTYWYGAYRPTENSIMNHNTGGYNAPSREAIYYRVMKLSEGVDWEYDYETFVSFDQAARTSATTSTRERARNFVERPLPPLHPPVVMNRSWRDK